jgi:uncharacterized protein DUF6847
MKLAEALVLRADYQKRLEQLKFRLIRSAKVQEGDEPAENPVRLLDELEDVATRLAELIRRINRTNSAATLQSGVTLTDALATRDVLLKRRGVYAELANAAAIGQERYSRSEVKFKSTVNISEIQSQVDTLSREYRELDSRLQEANWAIELVD